MLAQGIDLEFGWGTAIVAFLGGLSVILTGFIMKMLTARGVLNEQKKKERDDTITEWANLFDTTTKRMQEEIDEGKKENKGLREQIHKLRDRHHEDMIRVTVEAAQCKTENEKLRGEINLVRAHYERENAELRGEVKMLQSTVHRLQVAIGDEIPSSPCLIIAETDGTIRDASPGVGPVLEWLPGELVGQNIEVVVPEDLREMHREALKKVEASGTPPWSEKTILTEALTKTGKRKKVSVRVKGWQTGGGHWLLSGEIQERVSQ